MRRPPRSSWTPKIWPRSSAIFRRPRASSGWRWSEKGSPRPPLRVASAAVSSIPASSLATPSARRWHWLPAPNTWKYHALLATVRLCVLGPLGGLAASYMNFSIGFYVSGQVLAGILGSTVTFGYGADGKHGANYIQTIAASVAQMSAMAVVLQAMVWLGLPQPPVWKALLYLTCIGMFGVGVGMLLTPILVDRMQLTYPSGLAVANILPALTDPVLLRRSVATLGSGML